MSLFRNSTLFHHSTISNSILTLAKRIALNLSPGFPRSFHISQYPSPSRDSITNLEFANLQYNHHLYSYSSSTLFLVRSLWSHSSTPVWKNSKLFTSEGLTLCLKNFSSSPYSVRFLWTYASIAQSLPQGYSLRSSSTSTSDHKAQVSKDGKVTSSQKADKPVSESSQSVTPSASQSVQGNASQTRKQVVVDAETQKLIAFYKEVLEKENVLRAKEYRKFRFEYSSLALGLFGLVIFLYFYTRYRTKQSGYNSPKGVEAEIEHRLEQQRLGAGISAPTTTIAINPNTKAPNPNPSQDNSGKSA